MFSLVHFGTAFVASCAAVRLGREGFASFEPDGANACLLSNCLWVEDVAIGWLLSWAEGRRVLCEVVNLDEMCQLGGSF